MKNFIFSAVLSNICIGGFCRNSERLLVVNYFCEKFDHRSLIGSYICLQDHEGFLRNVFLNSQTKQSAIKSIIDKQCHYYLFLRAALREERWNTDWSSLIFESYVFAKQRFHYSIIRSSHGRCSIKKVFLKILQNTQENTSARVSFLIQFPASLLQNRLWHRCFPVNFAKFLRTLFLAEHLRWLMYY